MVQDQVLKVGFAVVFPGGMVAVVLLGGEPLEPLLDVLDQSILKVVDIDRGRNVHRAHEDKPLLHPARTDRLLDLAGDANEFFSLAGLKPQVFRMRFHARQVILLTWLAEPIRHVRSGAKEGQVTEESAVKSFDIEPLESTHTEVGLLGAALVDGTREWLEELGEVPDDAVSWQPLPGFHSIGAVMLHIIDVESYWIEQVACGRQVSAEETQELMSDEVDQYRGVWTAPPRKPWSYYLGLHTRIRERTLRLLRELTEPERFIQFAEHSVSVRWILHHVVTHEAYHAGQAVLLKAMWERTAGRAFDKLD